MRARIYLVLFLLLVVIAGSAYACSEAMRVREVVVLGCEVKDPARVVDLASIAKEESVFKLKFKEIRAKIDADPYFDVETIRYVFPDKLRIQVHERKAGAVIHYLDSIIVVDETGYILEVRQNLGDLSLPVISGLRLTEGYEVGGTVTSSQPSQLDAMGVILAQLQSQNATQLISEINLDTISDLWMTTVSGYEVHLGNFENMESKIRWLRAVEPILVSEGYIGGTITVSTGKNASYLPLSGEGQAVPSVELPDVIPPESTNSPDTTAAPETPAPPSETPSPTDAPASTQTAGE